MDLRVAFLVESWGEPWNEGYKNLVRYIVEMLNDSINVSVIPADEVRFSLLESFDLIHIFNYNIPLHLLVHFARIKKPIAKHVAKKELDIGIGPLVKTLLNNKLVWDAFIVTTNILREEIKRLAKDKPIFYLPPPIPTSYFKKFDKDESRKLLGLESDKIYLGYTGTLNKFRNLEVILKVLKLIKNERVRFAISVTNITSEKITELKKLSTAKRVKFVSVKDVRLFYSAIDMLVYPVERRGAIEPPLTVLEAMSCGTLVVALDNIITRSIIKPFQNGFLFSTYEDLLDIISNVIQIGQDGFKGVSINARNTIDELFSFRKLKTTYLKALRLIAERV